MNEENQTTEPISQDASTESGSTDQTTTENTDEVSTGDPGSDPVTQPPAITGGGNMFSGDVVVTSPIDNREQTIIRSGDGEIHVIHEITLGEVVLSTIIMALLVFMILDRVIRR